jgi:hypothetical protein
MKKIYFLFLVGLLPSCIFAQTTSDGLMMGRNKFCTGLLYSHDSWKNYWEGDLKRSNGNIGTVTTSSLMWFGNYGVTNKINVIAMLPYVWTKASAGTMRPMEGVQDLSLAVKYKFATLKFDSGNVFKAFVVGSYSGPMSDYTPDFLPLSIGSASHRFAARLTLNYTNKQGWFVNSSTAYTYRNNITLDQPNHMVDGVLYNTTEAFMPNVFDFLVTAGYIKHGLQVQLSYIQQNTLGGDDIRRNIMPSPWNKMTFSKAEALAMYYLPMHKNLAIRGSYSYTVAGRNVGQSSSWLAGVLYTFHFSKNQ